MTLVITHAKVSSGTIDSSVEVDLRHWNQGHTLTGEASIAQGGTGSTTASGARTALGLAIGTDVQAYDAELAALAGLTSAADKGIQFTGSGTAATYDLTAAGKALLDDADAATQRTTLGLGNVDNTSDANKPVSTATQTALDLKANLASPTFTGTPAAPTAAVDTNTTQLATTAMVLAQAAAATPLGNAATAVVGTATRFARADHVHPGREVLTAARTYYVRTDGSDSNTGLADSAGGAFLTIQKAADTIASLDMSIYQVTVQVGNGTYTGGTDFGNWVGKLHPIIQGDTATPSNVVINPTSDDCFLNDGKLPWDVRGFQLDSTTSGTQLRGKAGGTIYFRSCDFVASAGNHIWFETGAKVVAEGNYTISGSPGGDGYHALITDGAVGRFDGITVTVSGSPNFAGAFAGAARNGTLRAASSTYTGGTPTGSRYNASLNAVIYTAGGGATYFPGDAAGSTATGGQYA